MPVFERVSRLRYRRRDMSGTKRRHTVLGIILAGSILAGGLSAAAVEPVGTADDLPVRSSDAAIVALIERASNESPSFHSMLHTIGTLHGIVYVDPGDCGHGVRACLVHVMPAGTRRILRVKVDTRKSAIDLMTSIGHELRHTIEVLGDRSVKSGFDLYFFYAREASMRRPGTFETYAAIAAGDAVRKELRQHARRVASISRIPTRSTSSSKQ